MPATHKTASDLPKSPNIARIFPKYRSPAIPTDVNGVSQD